MADQVYDPKSDEQHAPVANEDDGQTTPSPKTYDPRQDGSMHDKSDPRGGSASGAGEAPVDKKGLYNAEKDGATDSGSGSDSEPEKDGLFNPGDRQQSKTFRDRMKAKVTRKRSSAVAGAVGGVAAITIMVSVATVPLKIEHMVENLQNRFFSTSESAVKKAERKMFTRYVQKHVLPSYKNCKSTIDRRCSVKIIGNGKNPVSNMYRAWADNRLETKLAENYGIEFRYSKGTYYLKSPGSKDIDIGSDGNKLDGLFEKASTNDIRNSWDKGLEGETHWKKMMYHYKVGRLLEEKYGIRRCLAFCGVRDQFHDKKQEKKNAAKILITQRVITPRTETLGIVMECLVDTSCNPNEKTPASTEDGNAELEGVQQSETERKAQEKFALLAASYGITDEKTIDKMIKEYNDISEKGYTKHVLEKVLAKVGLKELGTAVADAAPIVGWVNRAATIISQLHKAGPLLKTATYLTNAPAAVSTYMAYRSYADEIHTGKADPKEVGSFVSSLGPGNNGAKNDPIVGGTSGAEGTPLYQSIMGEGSKASSTALLEGFLPTKAFASASGADGSQDYHCNDGKPPKGIVCPETKLGNNGSEVLDGITKQLETPPLSGLTAAADFWTSTVGKAINFALAPVSDALSQLPGVSDLTAFLSDVMQPFFNIIAAEIVPNPFGSNMSGGRTFDMMAAGANVAGNDACDQIGCQQVSPTTVASIIDEQKSAAKQQFDHQSMFARMFDTSSSYSLVTKIAMATPTNVQVSATNNMASIMSNPFGTLLNSFGSIFSDNRASAATNADSVDPFEIGTSAYVNVPDNPEDLWESRHCDDTGPDGPVAKWQAAATPSEKTGMPVHKDPEPCLLIKASTGEGGGNYDKSLLTKDDVSSAPSNPGSGDTSSSSGATDTSSGGPAPTGSAKALATQLTKYVKNGKVKCLTGGCPDIVNTGKGTSIKNASCYVDALDPALVGMLLKLAQEGHTFILSAVCTDHPSNPSSYHHKGKGVDFNTIDGVFMGPDDVSWDAAKVKAGKKLDQDIAAFMPKKTTGFGQIQCHGSFSFLSGFSTFDDACHHQHIQVNTQ